MINLISAFIEVRVLFVTPGKWTKPGKKMLGAMSGQAVVQASHGVLNISNLKSNELCVSY